MIHSYKIDINKSDSKQTGHYRRYKTGKVALVNPGIMPKIGLGEIKKPSLRLGETLIVDIDGTISDARWREHLIRGEGEKNWEEFFDRGKYDKPKKAIVDFIKENSSKYNIVILTGRPVSNAHDTIEWLRNNGIEYDGLYMRPEWEKGRNSTFKRKIYEKFLKGKTKVSGIIDDEPHIREEFQKIGIMTIDPGKHYDITQLSFLENGDKKIYNIADVPMSGQTIYKTPMVQQMLVAQFNSELNKYVGLHDKYIQKINEQPKYKTYITQSFNKLFKVYKEIDNEGKPMNLRMLLRRNGIPLWYLPNEDVMSAIL